ncbi:MAG: cyclic nucleotide-binding domain-containing protein [Bacteroidales bacterium]|nr:cyclic nucleotide-binding domain-containing protein [Bacteroidales bacterium]
MESGKTDVPYATLLTEQQIQEISVNSNLVNYKKKEIIFRQNTRTSHIMFIRSGLVKIFKEGRNSKFIVLKVAKPGNFLGLMSVFGSEIHQYSASSIDDTEIGYIDINIFKKIAHDNGEYSLRLIQLLSKDGLYIFDRLMSQSHKQLPGRIADVLLYFSQDIIQQPGLFVPSLPEGSWPSWQAQPKKVL